MGGAGGPAAGGAGGAEAVTAGESAASGAIAFGVASDGSDPAEGVMALAGGAGVTGGTGSRRATGFSPLLVPFGASKLPVSGLVSLDLPSAGLAALSCLLLSPLA